MEKREQEIKTMEAAAEEANRNDNEDHSRESFGLPMDLESRIARGSEPGTPPDMPPEE